MKAGLFLNTQFKRKDGLYPVVLRISNRGDRTYHPTGVAVKLDEWNEHTCRVRMNNPGHVVRNRILSRIEAAAEAAILDNRKISTAALIAKVEGRDEKLTGTFTQMARALLQTDPPKAWQTENTWRTILDKCDRYLPGIALEDIGPKSMRKYMQLDVAKGNDEATGSNNVRQIRAMYRRVCAEVGFSPVVVTKGLELKENTGTPRYVPVGRIRDVLAHKPAAKDQLAHDLWCFSFECCGLRYTDTARLKWTDLRDGWLAIEQNKTKQEKKVRLTERAMAILHRYAGGRYVFKVAGDRDATDEELKTRLVTINEALRERITPGIGGLPHHLTTHTARHTWTEWALSVKMPLADIKRLLGLKSWKAFTAYIARFNPSVATDAAQQMNEAFA